MKDIPGYEGRYAATKDGKIWSYPKGGRNGFNGQWLSPRKTSRGYIVYYLQSPNGVKQIMAHRLVALTYIPYNPSFPEVNHKDANKENNHVDNLEWTTREKNMRHAFDKGLIHILGKRERHPRAKLSERDVAYIREKYASGLITQTELAKKFHVKQPTISLIIRKVNWA